jgi:hypothetical protein
MNEEHQNDYRGFCLFNDVQNPVLRNKNRATVLSNMAEDNCKNNMMSPKGSALIMGYFSRIPDIDKTDVIEKYKDIMNAKGYQLA